MSPLRKKKTLDETNCVDVLSSTYNGFRLIEILAVKISVNENLKMLKIALVCMIVNRSL